MTYGVSLLHPHLPLCGAAALADCLARGSPAVWHGIAGPGVTYGVSLLLTFVQHTLLFPGLIHSGRVRRLIVVAPGDPHVRQTFLHRTFYWKNAKEILKLGEEKYNDLPWTNTLD